MLQRVQGGQLCRAVTPSNDIAEIRNIAEEIAARGHQHSAQVLLLECLNADAEIPAVMEVEPGAPLFHSRILHRERTPLQLEELKNPAAGAGLSCAISRSTPGRLPDSPLAPLERAAYSIEARQLDQGNHAPAGQAAMHEPCLLLIRRTWSRGQVVTAARLWHPGRHQFTGQL